MNETDRTETLVSVIIPCWNTGKYVKRCWESIKNQTIGIEALEVIFVDDCSTDNTVELISAFRDEYPENVKLITMDHKGYAGGARNEGIKNSSSKYLVFVDSDDYIDLYMIEELYNKAQKYDVDVVQASWKTTYEENCEGERTGEDEILDLTNEYEKKLYLIRNFISIDVTAKLYKRNLLVDNNIFFKENVLYEVIHFSCMLFFYINSVYLLRREVYFYRQHQESMMRSSFNSDKERDYIRLLDMISYDITERGLDEVAYGKYGSELQYYLVCRCLFDPMYRLFSAFDKQKDFYLESIFSRFPNVLNNFYIINEGGIKGKKCVELLRQNVSIWKMNYFSRKECLGYRKEIISKYNSIIAKGNDCLSAIRTINGIDCSTEMGVIKEISDLSAYFNYIRKEKLCVVMAGQDECSALYAEFINKTGIQCNLYPKYREAYIAITDGYKFMRVDAKTNELTYRCKLQYSENEWICYEHTIGVLGVSVKILSLGFLTQYGGENTSCIMVDNVDYSCKSRGINGVVIDEMGRVVDVWNVDTFGDVALRMRRDIMF